MLFVKALARDALPQADYLRPLLGSKLLDHLGGASLISLISSVTSVTSGVIWGLMPFASAICSDLLSFPAFPKEAVRFTRRSIEVHRY